MSEFVVVPRLELEVNLEDVSAAVEVAVRRLGYDSPTTQQKKAVTAFVKGNDVFVSLPTGGVIVLCVPSFVSVWDHVGYPTPSRKRKGAWSTFT